MRKIRFSSQTVPGNFLSFILSFTQIWPKKAPSNWNLRLKCNEQNTHSKHTNEYHWLPFGAKSSYFPPTHQLKRNVHKCPQQSWAVASVLAWTASTVYWIAFRTVVAVYTVCLFERIKYPLSEWVSVWRWCIRSGAVWPEDNRVQFAFQAKCRVIHAHI